jgi:ubiquitin carboxyl-terminal hydrolase 36/42
MSKLAKGLFTQKSNSGLSPKEIAHNLKYIGKFRLGRQEDSHEFIITLIDKMEEVILKQYKSKLDKRVSETNPIHQIFGGYLRSQVECIDSKYISNTYDPFVGISLN